MKYRITKYNPIYRDIHGAYKLEEWTAYSDINKKFGEKKFTLKEYVSTEDAYIKSVVDLFKHFKEKEFYITDVEMNNELSDFDSRDRILYETYKKLEENTVYILQDLSNILKLVLREYAWFEIHLQNFDITVIFGNDYYMYFEIGDAFDVSVLFDKVKANKLFIG